jgi:multidrug resistance efflux pump
MSRAITVKVATPKVIKALETKLAKMEKDFANKEANEAKYQKEYEKYEKAMTDYAIANIKKADAAVNTRYNGSVNITFSFEKASDFPQEPKREYEDIAEWKYNEAVEEISNALSILKMTDEEYVNASTMKSIAKYL